MRNDKIIKLAVLNIGIAIVNIIIFSDGLLHIDIGGVSALQTAFGITVILMSGILFIFGNYKLLNEKEKRIPAEQIKTSEDCIFALERNNDKKTFFIQIDLIKEQIKRLQKKKETINDILLQKFSSSEMSFTKFKEAILNVENVFYINIKSIINKLNAFDEEDYNQIRSTDARLKFSEEFIQSKLNIYNEYILFIKDAVEDNEEILLKLDKVLLEISNFNSLEVGEIENMSAMKEIDELIQNAKWYK